MPCFIIAEAGVNHNGSLDLALALVEEAARAQADAVKFQTFKANQVVSPFAEKAEYQKETTGDGSQYEMLKSLEFRPEYHVAVSKRCKELGIEFMSTAFHIDDLPFLIDCGLKRIKIPSGEICNIPMLKSLAALRMPIILSTGMSTLSEVIHAVTIIQDEHAKHNLPLHFLTVLHCTSNYPTQFEDVNLRAMQTIAQSTNHPVGYSDHTPGILIPPIAVAMGACIIEKHFTLDRNLQGPDHRASVEPHELKQMVQNIRTIELSLGNGEKRAMPSEYKMKEMIRRSLTLQHSLERGMKIKADDIAILRPGTGIAPSELPKVIGKTLKHRLEVGVTLQWSHFEE